ncbi:MAG TPA: ScyD/ScyE family protein [Segeticoccus sp.]|nr:ScyD/ScyE family protein [Segeticoccus sp.]
MSLKLKTLTATVGVTALAVSLAPMALAAPHPTRTLTDQVLLPSQISISHGRVYVADGGTSTLSRVLRNGKLKTLATGPQGGAGDLAGVDLSRSGRSIAYTWTNFAAGKSGLTVRTASDRVRTAQLFDYERLRNPDGKVRYGVPADASRCVKKAIAKATGGPATYKGIVDSHPYSVASLGKGRWAVAEAAGNDILTVDRWGAIRTLAVLPPQPLKITKRTAANLGLPHCTVGVTYRFEPVPTDVEVDRHGMLWVSTLPGGPEDPSLGARGSVYKVNPHTGKATRVATGFAGATNLAVAPNGTVYVAELFGGKVSVIRHGKVRTFQKIASPLSVEVKGWWLFVGTMAPMDENGPSGTGSILKIRR